MQAPSLEQLQPAFRGDLIEETHVHYETARKVYNGMIDKRPCLIARCVDVDGGNRTGDHCRNRKVGPDPKNRMKAKAVGTLLGRRAGAGRIGCWHRSRAESASRDPVSTGQLGLPELHRCVGKATEYLDADAADRHRAGAPGRRFAGR